MKLKYKTTSQKTNQVVFEDIDLEIKPGYITLQDLLKIIVFQLVEHFNERIESSKIFDFDRDLQTKKPSFKFGFFRNKKAKKQRSLESVIQAFEDELIMVFFDSQEIKSLDQEILINKSSEFVFLKLVPLVGGYKFF